MPTWEGKILRGKHANQYRDTGQSSVQPSYPVPKRGTAPPTIFPNVCCGHIAGLIKMPLGTVAGLGTGDIVLDGYPAPHSN